MPWEAHTILWIYVFVVYTYLLLSLNIIIIAKIQKVFMDKTTPQIA